MTETAHGALRADGERCAVAFERLYDFTPEELWAALTDPAQLGGWLAQSPRFDREAGGVVELVFGDGGGESRAHGRILTFDEPRVLEYEWRFPGEEESVVRFELVPQDYGTLLRLDHRLLGREAGAGYGAGWHAHLDALGRLDALTGESWTRRFDELLPAYVAQADALGWNRTPTSAVREALYRGDRAAAEALAAETELDVFDAAALGHVDRLQQLLDEEPELVAALSDDGFTPLHLACFAGGADAVRLLVARGAPLERLAEASFAQVRPLGTAVFARQHEAARALLEAGADPNGAGAGVFTPLQAAAANGDEPLARLLREHGATARN